MIRIYQRYALIWSGSFIGFLLVSFLNDVYPIVGKTFSSDFQTIGMELFRSLQTFPTLPFLGTPITPVIAVIVTAIVLTWPLLFPRSSRIAAISSLVVFVPLGDCLLAEKCSLGSERMLEISALHGMYWVAIVVVYNLRKLFHSLEILDVHGIQQEAQLLAYGFFLGIVLQAVVVLLFLLPLFYLVVFFAVLPPILSLGWLFFFTQKFTHTEAT